MQDKTLKEMDLRLQRLEKRIDTLPKPVEASLSEADVAAYHRVRSVLWDDGTCGINETSPCVISCKVIDKICKVIALCRICDVECSCGPCNIFADLGVLRGGAFRFGNLGR